MQFSEIASRFDVKTKRGNSVQAICPAHVDKKASLTITYNDNKKRSFVHCHAGCNINDILSSVNLNVSNLYIDEPEQNKQDPNIEAIYKYYDINNKLLFEKVRFKGKKFSQRRYIGNNEIWGLSAGIYYEFREGVYSSNSKYEGKGYKEKECKLQPPSLYNLPNLVEKIKEGYIVYIVEGEKDVETMKNIGLTATTASNGGGKGKGKWATGFNEFFKGASVVILHDNDKTGREFAEEIKRNLRDYAHKVKIVKTSENEKGDVTDWINEGKTREDLINLTKKTQWSYAPWVNVKINDKTGAKSVKINEGILANSIKNTLNYRLVGDVGNERTYVYIYENGVYKNISKNRIKGCIKEYIPDVYISANIIRNVTELLLSGDIISHEMLQGKQEIINIKNGLYNVNTGVLAEHTHKYLSDVQINACYNKKPKNLGIWDNYINTLTSNEESLKYILQEWAGLALSNYNGYIAKKALVLVGAGDTGKSQFILTLISLLGDKNTAQISMHKLGDRFSLGRMIGARIIHDADLPTKLVDDSALAVFKQLTGGDYVQVENKGKDPFDYKFTGVITYCTNKTPTISGDLGNHVFNRFIFIPCNNVIPDEKKDVQILDKLMSDSEYILWWAIEGIKRLKKNKFIFTSSDISSIENEKFKIENDTVREFFSDNYERTDNRKDRIKSSVIYEDYRHWCEINGYYPCGNKEFRNRVEQNIGIPYNKKYNGNPCYECITEKTFKKIEDDNSVF